MNKAVKAVLAVAAKKGLIVKKNQFKSGWSIYLPTGIYHALSDGELSDYIHNY